MDLLELNHQSEGSTRASRVDQGQLLEIVAEHDVPGSAFRIYRINPTDTAVPAHKKTTSLSSSHLRSAATKSFTFMAKTSCGLRFDLFRQLGVRGLDRRTLMMIHLDNDYAFRNL